MGGSVSGCDSGESFLGGVVARFAERTANPYARAAELRLRAPMAVTVEGRPGVGRDAVARALAASDLRVVRTGGDVRVVVIAESMKPEDRQVPAGGSPVVVVLNKADLSGRVPGGPLAAAARTAADISVSTGLPVVPMVAHLATVELDDELVTALHTLAENPADMTSGDAFVSSGHPLSTDVRQRLLRRLDRFGLAHAVLRTAEGADAAALTGSLRELSRLGQVVARLADVAAEVTYRRVREVLRDLHRAAAESDDDELWEFLADDEVVIAVMACAVGVMEAAGLEVDPRDDADTHLSRAVHWRRYAEGPLGPLHRRCAADISRGSLRLLSRAASSGAR